MEKNIISNRNFEIRNSQNKELIYQYYYEPEYYLLIQKWYGEITEEDIIKIYKISGVFSFENKNFIQTSVSDISKIEGTFHHTNTWIAEHYIPKSILHGYRNAVFVEPTEFFAKLALEDATEELKKIEGLENVMTFESFEEAYEYAKTLKKEV
jgi:hypothetical protein